MGMLQYSTCTRYTCTSLLLFRMLLASAARGSEGESEREGEGEGASGAINTRKDPSARPSRYFGLRWAICMTEVEDDWLGGSSLASYVPMRSWQLERA
jgi:hypothetical protein